jgi:hypothetical protein
VVCAAIGCGALAAGAGQAGGTASDSWMVRRAQKFRTLVKSGEYDAARAMMSHDPRRWWGEREGDGSPWKLGPKHGPWAAWDDHFHSQTKLVEWREEPGAAIIVQKETNDYFQLLERGWVTNEIVYYFDDHGKIDGWLVRAVGERPPGRTEEFLAWARENDPEELAALMPDGEVDPTGDHPERFRRLLNRWRDAAGLERIE